MAFVTNPLKFSGGVLQSAGFKGNQGAKSGSTGFGIGVAPTLTAGQTNHTVYALQGNGIDRSDTAGCNGCGWRTDEMYTLNTIDRPAVCYGVDCRNATLDEEKTHTLQAKANGGISLNCTPSIVYRRCKLADQSSSIPTLVYDARGNGDGDIAPTMTGHHNANISDYTAILVEKHE